MTVCEAFLFVNEYFENEIPLKIQQSKEIQFYVSNCYLKHNECLRKIITHRKFKTQ